MDRSEYQRRRRALEELYQSDLRLLRAAHESRVRSLEALWLALDEGDAPPQIAFLLPAEGKTLPEPAAEAALPAPDPVLPPVPAQLRKPDLREALDAAFPALPAVFSKADVVQALGWEPSRSSLNRVLMEMKAEGLLVFERLSEGRTPSWYKKV